MNLSTTFPDTNPYLMHSLLPYAKFIAVVRNPLYGIRSEYYYFIQAHCNDRAEEAKRLRDADSFHLTVTNHLNAYEKCMELHADIVFCMYSYRNWIQPESTCIQVRLEATMYFYTLSQWLQYFPRDQFLIIRTEDLKENEAVVAAEMYNFIGAGTFRGKKLEKEEQSIQTEKHRASFMIITQRISCILKQRSYYWISFIHTMSSWLNFCKMNAFYGWNNYTQTIYVYVYYLALVYS